MNKDKLYRIKDFTAPSDITKDKGYVLFSYNRYTFLRCANESTNLFIKSITNPIKSQNLEVSLLTKKVLQIENESVQIFCACARTWCESSCQSLIGTGNASQNRRAELVNKRLQVTSKDHYKKVSKRKPIQMSKGQRVAVVRRLRTKVNLILLNTVKHTLNLNQKRDDANKNFCFKESFVSIIVPKIFWYSISKTNYTIVRPLINLSRCTITMSCILIFLPVYPDLTNFKKRYSRNRMRQQIIPSIQFFFNPKVEKALFKFSEFYNRDALRKKGGKKT